MLLFLPVPLVLLLFTRAPLGILPSLGIGVALMLTHRLYARPWALARAGARCLWCGADLLIKATAFARLGIPIQDPLGIASWAACGDAHARSARAVLMWAQRQSRWLQLGILGSLAVFLAWALAAGLAQLSPPAFAHASAFFRLGAGATVLPLGWLAARTKPKEPADVVRAPFLVHLSALVGLRAVQWLFRLIGLLWFALGVPTWPSGWRKGCSREIG